MCLQLLFLIDWRFAVEYKNINADDIVVQSWSSKSRGAWDVNADTGVKITHIPTGIIVTCEKERSQHKNRHLAMTELSRMISN